MPNSKDTIKNKMMRALLKIMESPDANIQQRLDASALLLKARELAKQRDRITPSKQKKLTSPSFGALGTR